MSQSSKSVSFDEYRQHSWREDAYQRTHDYQDEEETENKKYGLMSSGRYPKSHHEAGNSFYGMQHLPPPLEPRERLVRCIDPATAELSVIPNWWKCRMLGGGGGGGREAREFSQTSSSTPTMTRRGNGHGRLINDNYIMPSSLAPVVSQASNSRPSTFIPPPTAYRDEISGKVKNPYHQQSFSYYDEDDDGGGHSAKESASNDIIEIKRPGTVCLGRNESEYGLAYHYNPISHRAPETSAVDLSNSLQTRNRFRREDIFHQSQSSRPQRSRVRTGIFNLPEVYSPPPLEPASQHVSVLSTDPSQLQGLMPSFFENTGTCTDKHRGFEIKSPRLAYSEPVFKSDMDRKPYPQKTIRPATTRLSPRMRNKTFVVNENGCEVKRNCITGRDQTGQKLPTHCSDRRLMGHHKSSPGDSPESIDGNFSEVDIDENNFRPKHDGSGDNTESCLTTKQAKLSVHNCLSPRARISRLQPSVITPAITESLLCDCLANLKSPHWEDNFEAFSQIYNLTEIHPGRVKSILNRIIWHGLPHLSSPRTKLARMACICFKRLFQTQKRSMETEGEKIFYRLLDLCGGLANNFIQQESREALVAAVEHLDPLKSLSFLELHGAKHKNPHVREFSAYLLSAIMDELPQNKLMNKEFSPRIVPMIVSFLREGLLQTRLHAKLALDKIFDHPTFESKLRRYVSPENVRHIADTLREFRERRSGHI